MSWWPRARLLRPTRWQFLLIAFSGLTAILLLAAANGGHEVARSYLSSHVYGGWNGGPVDLTYNQYWAANWNQSVLDNARRNHPRDRWDVSSNDGIHPKQKKNREDTIVALRQLVDVIPVAIFYDYAPFARIQNLTVTALAHLADCLEQDECSDEELKVVIAGDMHFGDALNGGISGENIWARSSMDSLRELGHTVLYSYDIEEMFLIYRAVPNLVTTVLMSAVDAGRCAQVGIPRLLTDRDQELEDITVVQGEKLATLMREYDRTEKEIEKAVNGNEKWGWRNLFSNAEGGSVCVQRKGREEGIPIWKMFSFHFWSGADHPLGSPWTLSPEDYSTHPTNARRTDHNFYLGYSVEAYCKTHRQPIGEKLDRALVYAKDKSYFNEGSNAFWHNDRTFEHLKERTGMQFLALASSADTVLPDPGLTNLGQQNIGQFYDHLAKSQVLIGLGRPFLSPTPYDALCLGVPFLNPILDWDHDNPSHQSAWRCQHDGLLSTGKPYVHHVHAGDLQGLEDALQHARENPFDAYILPSMTPEANRIRHQALVNMDWRALAQDWIPRAKKEGRYMPFMI